MGRLITTTAKAAKGIHRRSLGNPLRETYGVTPSHPFAEHENGLDDDECQEDLPA
jgi:hypothetical protein